MVSLKHKFNSAKADGGDNTFVKPTNWNAEHDLTLASKSVVGALVPGPAVELPLVTTASGDDGTIWTKASIQAAIASAIATTDIPQTGDLKASLQATKPNWLLLNGQTIGNVGSTAIFANANAENLFGLLWAINAGTWPILDATGAVVTRGATANADWLALRKLAVPDARGCAIGMVDLSAGVNTLITLLGIKVGEQDHRQTIAEMAPHDHGWIPREGNSTPSTSSGNVRGGSWTSPDPDASGNSKGNARSEPTGGDPTPPVTAPVTPPFTIAKGSNVVQPTMGANIFIKL
jgi:hypothetical protein